MSWIRLGKAQELSPHQHSTVSIIIVTEGQVKTIGETKETAECGDIIIPAHVIHGFIEGEPDGPWGLSTQFERLGQYENMESPVVYFIHIKDMINRAI